MIDADFWKRHVLITRHATQSVSPTQDDATDRVVNERH